MKKSIFGYLCSCSIGMVASASVMFSMSAAANPTGVPVGDPPLSCITTNSRGGGNNYQIDAVTGKDANNNPILWSDPASTGTFPYLEKCFADTSKECSVYSYQVTSRNGETVSQSLFAVSADQDLHGTKPSAFYKPPGEGDSSTGWLEYARHEYPVRFNSNGTVFNGELYIVGVSAPRLSTAYVRGGKIDESCLIAGPGAPGNPFAPTSINKIEAAAGGKCPALLTTNAKGEVINIQLFNDNGGPLSTAYPDLAAKNAANNCVAGLATPDPNDPNYDPKKNKFKLNIGGNPLQFLGEGAGKSGITFGTGTTTVYLPSGWAICTEAPCPGTTTYLFTY
jgi:hypothetical protein